MSTKNSPHDQAVELVEAAILERTPGNAERTRQLNAQALELESIRELEERDDRAEPTWSVLHCSAGWMAFNSNQSRLAERLACKALVGDSHPEIAKQLRDLLEQVRSRMAGEGRAA